MLITEQMTKPMPQGKAQWVKVHLRSPSDAKCRRTPTSRPPTSGIRN